MEDTPEHADEEPNGEPKPESEMNFDAKTPSKTSFFSADYVDKIANLFRGSFRCFRVALVPLWFSSISSLVYLPFSLLLFSGWHVLLG